MFCIYQLLCFSKRLIRWYCIHLIDEENPDTEKVSNFYMLHSYKATMLLLEHRQQYSVSHFFNCYHMLFARINAGDYACIIDSTWSLVHLYDVDIIFPISQVREQNLRTFKCLQLVTELVNHRKWNWNPFLSKNRVFQALRYSTIL